MLAKRKRIRELIFWVGRFIIQRLDKRHNKRQLDHWERLCFPWRDEYDQLSNYVYSRQNARRVVRLLHEQYESSAYGDNALVWNDLPITERELKTTAMQAILDDITKDSKT